MVKLAIDEAVKRIKLFRVKGNSRARRKGLGNFFKIVAFCEREKIVTGAMRP
jgi:hypothetical protein